jgi:hypothetical protein
MSNRELQLPDQARDDIFALADFIQNVVDARLHLLWSGLEDEYQTLFETVGDMAYGKFNGLLLQPVRKAMADAGLKASPRLPGSFQSSREWGNQDETHQQRWMTSKIIKDNGTVLGTIAIGSHHDHSRFRLPRSPEVIALRVSRPKEVVAALSIIKPEFAEAEEFRIWYAKYLADEDNAAADI